MAERRKFVLQACWNGLNSHSRVVASLCFAPCTSTPTLMTPSSNVVFFVGDRVEGTDNSEIERLSQPETIISILVSKLGPLVNVWIIEPSHYKIVPQFKSSFAIYENLLPSLSPSGDPLGYNPKDLPAARAMVSLLQSCLAQIRMDLLPSQRDRVALGKQPEANGNFLSNHGFASVIPCDPFSTPKKCPRTILLGFSKGGVVLNQLLAELTHFEDLVEEQKMSSKKNRQHHSAKWESAGRYSKLEASVRGEKEYHNHFMGSLRENEIPDGKMKDSLLPSTVEEFLRSIEEIHYVDVGLNCPGAYQTDAHVLEGLARAARMRDMGLLVSFHGTPRQWHDRVRHGVGQEKDKCVALLQEAASKQGDGKLHVAETLYFDKKRPSLQMHFEIIEALIVSSCGGVV